MYYVLAIVHVSFEDYRSLRIRGEGVCLTSQKSSHSEVTPVLAKIVDLCELEEKEFNITVKTSSILIMLLVETTRYYFISFLWNF